MYINILQANYGILEPLIALEDGLLKCSFKRQIQVSNSDGDSNEDVDRTVSLDESFYLLLGYGETTFDGLS